jgi:hypothetical protein
VDNPNRPNEGELDPAHYGPTKDPDMLNYAKLERVTSRSTMFDGGFLSMLLIVGLGTVCLVAFLLLSGSLRFVVP